MAPSFCDDGYHRDCQGCSCWCHTSARIPFVEDDGGRAAAGYRGYAGDCGARAVTIALGLDYRETYEELAVMHKAYCEKKAKYARSAVRKQAFLKQATRSARNGLYKETVDEFVGARGWVYVNLAVFGEPPARFSDLPTTGSLVVSLRKHFAAVVDGTLHDTYDSTYEYDRPVYGYWRKA